MCKLPCKKNNHNFWILVQKPFDSFTPDFFSHTIAQCTYQKQALNAQFGTVSDVVVCHQIAAPVALLCVHKLRQRSNHLDRAAQHFKYLQTKLLFVTQWTDSQPTNIQQEWTNHWCKRNRKYDSPLKNYKMYKKEAKFPLITVAHKSFYSQIDRTIFTSSLPFCRVNESILIIYSFIRLQKPFLQIWSRMVNNSRKNKTDHCHWDSVTIIYRS